MDREFIPPNQCCMNDPTSVYSLSSSVEPAGKTLIFQNTHRVQRIDSLFYTPATVWGDLQLKAMVDSGSMACTMSEVAERLLLQYKPNLQKFPASDVVIIGCGGQRVTPKVMYELELSVYACKMVVPVLVVPGQTDDLILGSNAIKWLIQKMKETDGYWRLVSSPVNSEDVECHQFLSLLSNVERWKGGDMPDKVGTAKLKEKIILEPHHEHLAWAQLPESTAVSVGCTVIVEPTHCKCRPRNVIIGRVITPMWGSRWVPFKIMNPTDKVIILKKNTKIVDVFTCIAVEEMSTPESLKINVQCAASHVKHVRTSDERRNVLDKLELQDLDLDDCEVSEEWKDGLLNLIEKYESTFSRGKMDCGEATDFVHKIHLVDEKPFRLPYRRVAPSHYDKLRTALNEMEVKGIIRKSQSEYASPLVLVWKKNGDLRICTDFRWLNAKTVKDAHPLPHQADALAALGGNVFFSTMDLTSGFYNVPLFEEHKKYTAFSSPFGLHEYNRLPQGLTNSPATFMRMMMSIFGDENFTSLLCYLDDLMVFAPSERVALDRLELVFSRLSKHNLKLAPKKCMFLRRSVRFLGHIVTGNGVQTDPEKVKVISDIQTADLMEADGITPSQKKIRSFLGMILYYQHFIIDCSAKAKPLFSLLSGQSQKRAQRKCSRMRKPLSVVKLSPEDWTSECRTAFETLKQDLLHSVTLAHPDFIHPFILSVDASFDGIGAVLSQVPPGEKIARPVAFASKTLSKSQMNYPAHRLEFLALKWAVCDKFSHWLKGRHFTAWSDNNPLTYILTKPRLDACEQRWVAKLAAYDFDLKYVPGARNVVADALSREPFVKSCVSHRLLKEPYISLLDEVNGVVTGTVQDAFRVTNNCQNVQATSDDETENELQDDVNDSCSGSIDAAEVSAFLSVHCDGGVSPLPVSSPTSLQLPDEDPSVAIPFSRIANLQEQDNIVGRVINYVLRNKRPSKSEKAKESSSVTKLLKHWKKLKICNHVLYRVKKDRLMNKKLFQYVVPDSLKLEVLRGVHDSAGHQGSARTLSLAVERFFWPGMSKDIMLYVKNCQRCVVGKTPEPNARAPLEHIRTSEPMELVCIDFWSAEQTSGKVVDVLVVTDHFSKMAHAFPCHNQSAKQVAHRLWNDLFCIYGFPKRIHSDQGANFESKIIKNLLEMAGVQKSHTTPYHPMGNGLAERFNRTLGNMIRALPVKSKARWPQLLRTLTFSYNCTVHETTGFAPFYLMFGRIPRLPIDIMFQHVLCDERVVSHHEFVTALRRDLSTAAEIARKHSLKEQNRHAILYNRKVRGSPLAVGDRVLLANRGEKGKRKVADKWDSVLYEIQSVRPEINVYRIKDVQTGKEKVVHRNLLLPVNFLSWDDGEEESVRSDSTGATCGSALDSALMDDPDPVSKTSEWLLQMDGTHDHDDMQDATCGGVSDISDEMTPENSGNDRYSPEPEHVPEPAESIKSLSASKPNEYPSCLQEPDNRLAPVICKQPTSTHTGHITTRLGRSVKPPNRLICEIDSQKIVESDSHSNAQVIFQGNNFVVELLRNIFV